MPPRKGKDQGKVTVAPASSMLAQPFRLHVQNRHPMMRFRSKHEHIQDHRLHQATLDHTHAEVTTEELTEEQELS